MNQFLVFIILFLLLLLIWKTRPKKEKKIDYSKAYKADLGTDLQLPLVSKFFQLFVLTPFVLRQQILRLLDLVEPKSGEGYMTKLNKVQSKHVDFVLTDQDMRVKAILELDDSSHDCKYRMERDHFVDQVLTGAGYKVIHTRSITRDTLNRL